jgi:hypothetical protein
MVYQIHMRKKGDPFMKAAQATKRDNRIGTVGIIVTLALMGTTLILSGQASAAARNGILLCGKTLIPAIFPFLVLNGILMRLGFPAWIGRKVGKPLGRLFGIRPACVAAVFVGLFSGFPTGAASAHQICESGLGDDRDRDRGVLLASVAAPGFLIAGVGNGMLGSPLLGLALYLFQLAAIFSVGILDARLFSGIEDGLPLMPLPKPRSLFLNLSESLREAANATVGICGAVIFFSALGGIIGLLPLPSLLRCVIVGLLEITAGASLSASLLPHPISFLVIAGIVGWSGLSVHAQTVMVTGGKLKVGRHLLSKALTALLTVLFAATSLLLGVI